MKKMILHFMVSFFCILVIFSVRPFDVIHAESDEFENVTLVSQPKISDSDKVSCKITWETSMQIFYLKVTITLQNRKQQVFEAFSNSDDKFSSIKHDRDNNNEYYLNTLEFDLSNHQSGNMKIKFDYSYVPIIYGDSTKSCTYIFATGSWIDKQPAHIAIISGVVITLCCGITTYVIIENSHRTIGNRDQGEEEDENNE